MATRNNEIVILGEEDKSINLKDYFEINSGSGCSFNVVFSSDKSRRVVVKKASRKLKSSHRRLVNEGNILSTLHHKNIVDLLTFATNPAGTILVLEYVDGIPLFDEISDNGEMEEDRGRKVFSQIAAGISYLHKEGIAHRDIKLENIIIKVDKKNTNADLIKIIDFDLSAKCGPSDFLVDPVGSYYYCAPEIARNFPYNGHAGDWFAAGVVLFTIVFGCFPWGRHFTKEKLIRNAVLSLVIWPDDAHKIVSKECRKLISSLLKENWIERARDAEILHCDWLNPPSCSSSTETEEEEEDERDETEQDEPSGSSTEQPDQGGGNPRLSSHKASTL